MISGEQLRALKPGDVVLVDTAPLSASPTSTGRSIRARVVNPHNGVEQVQLVPYHGGHPLYVFRKWILSVEKS